MFSELLLLTVRLIGVVLAAVGGFCVGRFFSRKVKDFFDRRL